MNTTTQQRHDFTEGVLTSSADLAGLSLSSLLKAPSENLL